jgi:hypothetical protein
MKESIIIEIEHYCSPMCVSLKDGRKSLTSMHHNPDLMCTSLLMVVVLQKCSVYTRHKKVELCSISDEDQLYESNPLRETDSRCWHNHSTIETLYDTTGTLYDVVILRTSF